MKKTLISFVLLICIFPATRIQAQVDANSNAEEKVATPTIEVISLEIGDKALNMTYEIINHSEDEIWFFAARGRLKCSCSNVYVAEDSNTLTIEMKSHVKHPSRYTRLRPGQSQIESILLEIPVYTTSKHEDIIPKGHATHLAIELEYYQGNLPKRVFRTLEEEEKNQPRDPNGPIDIYFNNTLSETVVSRDEEIFLWLDTSPEKVSRTFIDNIFRSYEEISFRNIRYELPDLIACTKIEIKYQPSMLEYFFPYTFQQSLMSPEELKYLQSNRSLVLDDITKSRAFDNDMNKEKGELLKGKRTILYSTILRYRSYVDFTCRYDNKPQISFLLYNDNRIRIDDYLLSFPEGFPSLKMLTPRIQALDLRMRCAANLKNQWYRFRFYRFHEAIRRNDLSLKNHVIYPAPSKWCDDILQPYPVIGFGDKRKKTHICPSAGAGKCHYAMNPNCEPNSPGDMVLLFETKASWNQHGGPELFTFDNHDPKGGCVLLNDGTVKFIRTEEELKALKWK
jgi:hypothetical protein